MKTAEFPRRRLVLFGAALLLPYAVLLVLAFRMTVEDREVRERRSEQGRRAVVQKARQALLDRLETIRRDEAEAARAGAAAYRHSETALVAWIEGDRLTLPWEEDPAARAARQSLSGQPFASRLQTCDRAERPPGGSRDALRCYREAAAAASDPGQAAWASLLAARAADSAGDAADAVEAYRALLETSPSISDEDGVPLRLYAAQRLAGEAETADAVAHRTQEVLAGRPWLPPLACYVASSVTDRLAGPEAARLAAAVAGRIRLIDQAQSLQEEFARRAPDGRAWISYGEDPWLVSAAPAAGKRTALVAIKADDALPPVGARFGVRFAPAHETQGEALGAELPGLKAVVERSDADGAGSLERLLFRASLGLLAAAMLFAAYLLWRDLQRDLRLAALRSQFVSSVSHELKTPLTAIRMMAETLQMDRVSDPRARTEYLDIIVNEAARLTRLVEGVLLFSRIEQNRHVYRFRELDAGECVRAAAHTLAYPLQQGGFRLSIEIEPGLPGVLADEDALRQAVLNLLGNAMKYSGESRDIGLSVRREGGQVAIRVTDRGVGIPPSEQDRVWERFYRVDTPENRAIPGAGLGLALVAQIARAHGGNARVESEPGKGSVFTVLLPAKETA